MVAAIFQSISVDTWVGAVLGTMVSLLAVALLKIAHRFVKTIYNKRPLYNLLSGFADPTESCLIFLPWLYTDNCLYWTNLPDYFPPRTSNLREERQNVPYTIAKEDMITANEVVNLLGQTGRRKGIEMASIIEKWDVWDANIFTIGGNFKTARLFSIIENPYAILADPPIAFEIINSQNQFINNGEVDYGLIYKVTHPITKKKCIILMGIGVLGTEISGYYFNRNGKDLGKLFGNADFAIILRGRLSEGKELAQPQWFYPEPKILRKILHPFLWFSKYRKYLSDSTI